MTKALKALSRRRFLIAAGAGGAAAAAALAAANAVRGVRAQAEGERAKRGYRVSEHVSRYYRTTKV